MVSHFTDWAIPLAGGASTWWRLQCLICLYVLFLNCMKSYPCLCFYNYIKQTNLSYIFAILVSPLPFFRAIRVVEACAKMLPPIGFFGSAWKQLIHIKNCTQVTVPWNSNTQKICQCSLWRESGLKMEDGTSKLHSPSSLSIDVSSLLSSPISVLLVWGTIYLQEKIHWTFSTNSTTSLHNYSLIRPFRCW